ncbi:MAG: IS1182 family transposase [Acidobacteriaceae bacterium]|nr:IS1182 family transposase [Acidobacteriaceae bacterium]
MTRSSPLWLQFNEQLDADHLARLIDRGVDQLDLTPLEQSYTGRGSLPYSPTLLLKIVLFEIHRGRPKPAQWYLDTTENIALQWLGMGIQPARSVWYLFAARVRPLVDGFNHQVLQLAQTQGHTTADCGALDGTFLEANASRHHLLNAEQLQQRLVLLQAATQQDAAASVPTEQPYWMAQTPASRTQQQQQYQTAQAHLDERLAENERRIPSQRQEAKKIRISVTDPEAALGKDKFKVFRPLYNVQYVRDVDTLFILGYDTVARNYDAGMLVPMMKRTEQLTGHKPKKVLLDSGYITGLDLAEARQLEIALYGPWKENDYSEAPTTVKQLSKAEFKWDATAREYRCPQGQRLSLAGTQNRTRCLGRTEKVELYRADAKVCASCPLKAKCCPKASRGRSVNRSEHEELIEEHRAKMATPEAKEIYKRRRQTVEPSIGDSKEHRNYRRVHGRGLEKAKGHTALTVLAHNLYELMKTNAARSPVGQGP